MNGSVDEIVINVQSNKAAISKQVLDQEYIAALSNTQLKAMYSIENLCPGVKGIQMPQDILLRKLIGQFFPKFVYDIENHESILDQGFGDTLSDKEKEETWINYHKLLQRDHTPSTPKRCYVTHQFTNSNKRRRISISTEISSGDETCSEDVEMHRSSQIDSDDGTEEEQVDSSPGTSMETNSSEEPKEEMFVAAPPEAMSIDTISNEGKESEQIVAASSQEIAMAANSNGESEENTHTEQYIYGFGHLFPDVLGEFAKRLHPDDDEDTIYGIHVPDVITKLFDEMDLGEKTVSIIIIYVYI